MDILNFLKRKEMTQQELGNAIGTTNQNVNRWVTGKGVPSYEMCKKLLRLGITVEELFGIDYSNGLSEEQVKSLEDEDRKIKEGAERALHDMLERDDMIRLLAQRIRDQQSR